MHPFTCKNGEVHTYVGDRPCEVCGLSQASYLDALHSRDKILKALDEITQVANGYDQKFVGDCLHQGLCHTHPTLQQSFIASLAYMAKRVAEDINTDARNEDAVRWCRDVAKLDGSFARI